MTKAEGKREKVTEDQAAPDTGVLVVGRVHRYSGVIMSCLFISHVTQSGDIVTSGGGKKVVTRYLTSAPQYLASVSLTAAGVAISTAVPVSADVHRIN